MTTCDLVGTKVGMHVIMSPKALKACDVMERGEICKREKKPTRERGGQYEIMQYGVHSQQTIAFQ